MVKAIRLRWLALRVSYLASYRAAVKGLSIKNAQQIGQIAAMDAVRQEQARG